MCFALWDKLFSFTSKFDMPHIISSSNPNLFECTIEVAPYLSLFTGKHLTVSNKRRLLFSSMLLINAMWCDNNARSHKLTKLGSLITYMINIDQLYYTYIHIIQPHHYSVTLHVYKGSTFTLHAIFGNFTCADFTK